MRNIPYFRATATAMLAALSVSSPRVGQAQSVAAASHDARFQPWLGCWTPAGSMAPVQVVGAETLGSPARTMVCVVPGATATGIEIINFAGGAVVEKTVIDPSRSIAKTVDACSGAETSKWSADGRRLLMRGEFVCANGAKRVETGIMSMDVDGQWVQAQSVALNGKSSTFLARFKDTGIALEGVANGAIVERPLLDLSGKRISPPRDACNGTESVTPSADGSRVVVKSDYTCAGGLRRIADAEFARTANGNYERVGAPTVVFGSASSRAYAGAEVSMSDVLEVSKAVDVAVAEAWVADRGQQFSLNGKELVRLADNGMPSRVVDLVVAMANPRTFTLRRAGEAVPVATDDVVDRVDDRRMAMSSNGCAMAFDYCYGMMGMGWLYGADRYYGWSPYGYQFNRFGNGFGNGFGFGNGGFWGPGYYNGSGPIVVVNPNTTTRGRAVYGQGYTRGSTASPSSSAFGGSSSARTSTPSTSAGSSSSGSSGASSSGGGSSSSGRTAKPRGGGN